jgi:hypothetical protein
MCTVGAQFSLYSLQYSRRVISLHSTTTQKVSPSFLKKKCINLPPQKLICRAVIYERFMVNPQNDKKINQHTTPFLFTHTATLTFKWSRFRSVYIFYFNCITNFCL